MLTPPNTHTSARAEDRTADALRPVTFEVDFLRHADASVLVSFGDTRVLCTASVEDSQPRWMSGTGDGWVTAEYSMLPASTGSRRPRDVTSGKLDGRSVEIQRLIGRTLRAVVDRSLMGPRTITVDCDVLDADGGTRCASICGGYVALHRALDHLVADSLIEHNPIIDSVAAVSCGIVDGQALLDLAYAEDSTADADANIVMTGAGRLIEVQVSAERDTYSREQLDELITLATTGCTRIGELQREAISR